MLTVMIRGRERGNLYDFCMMNKKTMKTIENHDVKIFTDNIEDAAMEQIRN